MIPWKDFENRSQFEWEGCRADLCQYQLMWVESGPTMAEFLLNSPMLELAHERRFVVTQQGWNNDQFAREHTGRIEACLTALDNHFQTFAATQEQSLSQPPDVEHVGLWVPRYVAMASADDLSHDMPVFKHEPAPIDHTLPTPLPPFKRARLERPRTPTVPSLIVEDSESSDEVEEQMQVIADAYRTGRTTSGRSSRARKVVRQRIPHSQLDGKPPDTAVDDLSAASGSFARRFEKSLGSTLTPDTQMSPACSQNVDSVKIHSPGTLTILDNT